MREKGSVGTAESLQIVEFGGLKQGRQKHGEPRVQQQKPALAMFPALLD
jgi:hypothetical protein